MEKTFNSLGVDPAIIKAIEEMGFVQPTAVQEKSIPHILQQEDLIVRAKTGSGKTGAFGIPMLQMIDKKGHFPQALILTPTRELAIQVDSDIKRMAKHMQVNTTVVYGQHSMNVEIEALKKGAKIVTGTPGRVYDHLSHGNLMTKDIKFLVLDEADRMLDMGFYDQVIRIVKLIPKKRVTLLFSATMPAEIQKICREYMKDPVTIEIESETKTVDTIHQMYFKVDQHEKRKQLDRILRLEQPESCMVFCNTRAAVDKVHDFLARQGYSTEALHGANTQSSRTRTINHFKKGTFDILVATDVAARGLHVDDLSLVINYDVPLDKDSYVHRIGRTGRAGSGGRAITMITSGEIMSLYEIEEHVGAMIEEKELPTDAELAAIRPKARKERVHIHPEKSDKPKQNKPKSDKPKSDKPKPDKPKTDKPVSDKPRYDKPRTDKPVSDKPRYDKPRQDRPRYEKPVQTVIKPEVQVAPIPQVPSVEIPAKKSIISRITDLFKRPRKDS